MESSTSGIRLQKLIADRGLASRRAAEKLIEEGRVSVNGEIVGRQGCRVDPERDRVMVDGRPLTPLADQARKTILLYKPTGYLSSMRDPAGRPLVSDLYRGLRERIYPIGRLDYNTSGLLLCSNDGALAHQLMHPRYKIEKEYVATVPGFFPDTGLAALLGGLRLADGPARALRAEILDRNQRGSRIRLVLGEGRNRQVRRMFESLAYPVRELSRTGYAFLTLAGLESGQWRRLQAAEINQLKALAAGGGREL
ncbi:MAG: rRNA pseudouridine synthase [Deltaproteobacteria bacterium]|nr:rRNA pseudouridine synthase [Deltaproteobacteria bacterium]